MPYRRLAVPETQTKVEFLDDPSARRLINEFLRPLLNDEMEFHHRYFDRQRRRQWSCTGIVDAARHYYFRVPVRFRRLVPAEAEPHSLAANASVLNHLQSRLRDGFRTRSDVETKEAAIQVQEWGGTDGLSHESGNVAEIEALNAADSSICQYLSLCDCSFGDDSTFDLSPFEETQYRLRSNAGFTKIYSLLFDNFAIYDSRVAAAIGMFVRRFFGDEPIPDALRLVWMPGDSNSLRNPNTTAERPNAFLRMENNDRGSRKHLYSNIRLNWILSEALSGSEFERSVSRDPGTFPVTPLRALEAALFMIGYDLSGNPPYPPALQ